ncbi:hypothetical protein [Flavobacterium sp. J27]|uniref:hypothetical protein n=1 Tax=Flavobacterium sp. J27 TaxID=2060419 RepID=UPI00103176A1|nr:hypothetical protein [Flavobacterium sp. J27]
MNRGLNGWFGRFLKSVIVRVATFVDATVSTSTGTIVNANFTEFANSIGSGGSSFWNKGATYNETLANIENDPRANYEPTYEEEIILNKFSEEITPLITNLATITASIINTPFTEEKFTIANELLQRFAVIKRYYRGSEKQGLSAEAISLRDLIIEVLLLKIEIDLTNEMAKEPALVLAPVSTTSNANEIVQELYPLSKVAETTFGTKFQIYKWQKLDLPPNDTTPVDTTPVQTINTNTTVKRFGYDWILWGVGGYGALKWLLSIINKNNQ